MRRELANGHGEWIGVAYYHVTRPEFRTTEAMCRLIRARVGRMERRTWVDRDGKALMTGWFWAGPLFK